MTTPFPFRPLLAALALFALSAAAGAQVATAEVQGVEATSPASRHVQAWQADGSVGEVRVRVRALDAAGEPVADAPVTWRVENMGEAVVYVVDASAGLPSAPLSAHTVQELEIDGGTTDADGDAWLLLDSMTAGDVRVYITVGGIEAKTFDGRDMRIVWF